MPVFVSQLMHAFCWVGKQKLPVSTTAEVPKPAQELAFWTKDKAGEEDLESSRNGKSAVVVADAT